MASQGFERAAIELRRNVHVRYQGTDTALVVACTDLPTIRREFEAGYRQRFAFLMPDRMLVIEAVSVEAVGPGERHADMARGSEPAPSRPLPDATVQMHAGRWLDAGLYVRESLAAGAVIDGPAIVAEKNATTVVEPGWQARLTAAGPIELQRVVARSTQHGYQLAVGTDADPVMLEVFNNLFMNIAEQMGLRLQNTAYSVNIKERLDFSCALFDADGQLIANAPHMPVHLGSMGESRSSRRHARAGRHDARRATFSCSTRPYNGGTHLPDVTVVMPVVPGRRRHQAEILFFVASRGHHADIGGITPGSMPPDLQESVEEEGVLFDDFLLVENGTLFCEAEVLRVACAPGHTRRANPVQNIADLKAQNRRV